MRDVVVSRCRGVALFGLDLREALMAVEMHHSLAHKSDIHSGL